MRVPPRLTVVCLCAAWCHVCEDYRPLYDATASAHPGARFVWVDIEDEAERLGDYEIDTFPTLVLLDRGGVRFAGPVAPQPAVLERLVENALAGRLAPLPSVPPALRGFVSTLGDRG